METAEHRTILLEAYETQIQGCTEQIEGSVAGAVARAQQHQAC